MKKMLLSVLLLSFFMAGNAIGADVSNVVKNPNMVKPPIAPIEKKALKLVRVPNVVGLTEPQARLTLEKAGFAEDEKRPQTGPHECDNKKGLVVRQDPVAGAMVAPHSKVKLAWCNL